MTFFNSLALHSVVPQLRQIARSDIGDKKEETRRVLNDALVRGNVTSLRAGRYAKRSSFPRFFGPVLSHSLLVSVSQEGKRDLFMLEGSQKRRGSKLATHVETGDTFRVMSVDKSESKYNRYLMRIRLERAHRLLLAHGQESYAVQGKNKQGKRSVYVLVPMSPKAGVSLEKSVLDKRPSELIATFNSIKETLMSMTRSGQSFSSLSLADISIDETGKSIFHGVPDCVVTDRHEEHVTMLVRSLMDLVFDKKELLPHQKKMISVSVLNTHCFKFMDAFSPESIDSTTVSPLMKARSEIMREFEDILILRAEDPVSAVYRFEHYIDSANLRVDSNTVSEYEDKGYNHKRIISHRSECIRTLKLPFSLRKLTHSDRPAEVLVMANLGQDYASFGKLKGGAKHVRFQYSLTDKSWKALKTPKKVSDDVYRRFHKDVEISKARGGFDSLVCLKGGSKGYGGRSAILSDKMDGDLMQLLQDRLKSKDEVQDTVLPVMLTPLEMLIVVTSILDDIRNLHLNNILHRDIKLENFLYRGEGESLIVHVDDFDLSVQLKEGTKVSIDDLMGTFEYCSPEIIANSLSKGVSRYTRASDYFAVGMALWFVFCGENTVIEDDGRTITNRISGYSRRQKGVFLTTRLTEKQIAKLFDDNYCKYISHKGQLPEERDFIKKVILSCLQYSPGARLPQNTQLSIDRLCKKGNALLDRRLSASVASSTLPVMLTIEEKADTSESEDDKAYSDSGEELSKSEGLERPDAFEREPSDEPKVRVVSSLNRSLNVTEGSAFNAPKSYVGSYVAS